ncbi:MAG: GGDEF domain-containing protein [Deltaproteobacteria bacterium]|nr:GGDEF domain-containing protein [Deltaproteobacteria bacterium]
MNITNEPPSNDGSLSQVVGQGERVQDMVQECAVELSSVNAVLKNELAEQDPLPAVEQALEQSEAVEGKVQEASEELSAMNRALKGEVRERQALEQQLETANEQGEADRHASLHDPLTGLPNRALFNDRLEHGLAQARRHGWTLAVMFVDLDDFKQINDRHGHEAGDGVLRSIAERLRQSTRSDDTVSRHGGDEFLYLLLEVKREEDIAAVAEKLSKTIQATCDVVVAGAMTRLSVKASIGISVFPKDGTTAEQLIGRADEAMYVAKRSGAGHAFAQAPIPR